MQLSGSCRSLRPAEVHLGAPRPPRGAAQTARRTPRGARCEIRDARRAGRTTGRGERRQGGGDLHRHPGVGERDRDRARDGGAGGLRPGGRGLRLQTQPEQPPAVGGGGVGGAEPGGEPRGRRDQPGELVETGPDRRVRGTGPCGGEVHRPGVGGRGDAVDVGGPRRGDDVTQTGGGVQHPADGADRDEPRGQRLPAVAPAEADPGTLVEHPDLGAAGAQGHGEVRGERGEAGGTGGTHRAGDRVQLDIDPRRPGVDERGARRGHGVLGRRCGDGRGRGAVRGRLLGTTGAPGEHEQDERAAGGGRATTPAHEADSVCLRQRMPASMNSSIWPSSTCEGLPSSCSVRRSFTSWYGCST